MYKSILTILSLLIGTSTASARSSIDLERYWQNIVAEMKTIDYETLFPLNKHLQHPDGDVPAALGPSEVSNTLPESCEDPTFDDCPILTPIPATENNRFAFFATYNLNDEVSGALYSRLIALQGYINRVQSYFINRNTADTIATETQIRNRHRQSLQELVLIYTRLAWAQVELPAKCQKMRGAGIWYRQITETPLDHVDTDPGKIFSNLDEDFIQEIINPSACKYSEVLTLKEQQQHLKQQVKLHLNKKAAEELAITISGIDSSSKDLQALVTTIQGNDGSLKTYTENLLKLQDDIKYIDSNLDFINADTFGVALILDSFKAPDKTVGQVLQERVDNALKNGPDVIADSRNLIIEEAKKTQEFIKTSIQTLMSLNSVFCDQASCISTCQELSPYGEAMMIVPSQGPTLEMNQDSIENYDVFIKKYKACMGQLQVALLARTDLSHVERLYQQFSDSFNKFSRSLMQRL